MTLSEAYHNATEGAQRAKSLGNRHLPLARVEPSIWPAVRLVAGGAVFFFVLGFGLRLLMELRG